MYILYLDESGNPDDPGDQHFVLGGVAVFERVTFFLAAGLDEIQSRRFPAVQPIEFHAAAIRSGRGFWRNIPEFDREAILQEIASIIANANSPGMVLFAAAVKKTNVIYGEEAVRRATEQVCLKFDTFLKRRAKEANDPQRGLLVFAEGKFHQRARIWVQGFRELGTRWGVLKNLSDIPYFASTKETRLLQIADFVAHATFLLYERQDPKLIRSILHRFDEQGGILHGLVHLTDSHKSCDCPACYSRRIPGNLGPWI
jgi:hypothetical protein